MLLNLTKSYPKRLIIHGCTLSCKRWHGTKTKSILVLNPGSTSLKCSVYNACDMELGYSAAPIFKKQIKMTINNTEKEIRDFLERNMDVFEDIQAIGLRAVHGGGHFTETVIVTNPVVDILKSIIPMAPVHMPPLLKTLAAVCTVFPNIPYYAAFDTAFYCELPEHAKFYPLPFEMGQRGILKYGFHGLNHRYCCERVCEHLGHMPSRLLTCHLGGGASVTAIKDRACVDTSMGYTPLDGIMMTSRCGSLDPSIVLQLVKEAKGDTEAVENILNRESGISGIFGLQDAGFEDIVNVNHPQAELAYKMFVDRLCKAIGSYTAVLRGLDCLVFSGGIGENSALLRQHVVEQFSFLGMQLDKCANEADSRHDRLISTEESSVKVVVIHANEEIVIAKDIQRLTNESFHI